MSNQQSRKDYIDLPAGCQCTTKSEVVKLRKELKDAQDNLTTVYMVGAADYQQAIRDYCQNRCPVDFGWANKKHDCPEDDCPLYGIAVGAKNETVGEGE